MADNFGPGGIYGSIPRLDSHGRPQVPMFLRWNPDPVGNEAKNLSSINPGLQRVIARARADNPGLSFVLGSGARSAQDQDLAKSWGWSRVGSQDGGDAQTHMKGQAADLWGLDSSGHVQFNPGQQQQIADAVKKAAQAEGVNLNWGGDWKNKDAPHFELTGGGSAAPAPAATSSSSAAPPGTTLNSNVIDTLSKNIAQIESGGWKNPYEAQGPVVKGRGSAIGKYQVMPENVAGWTQAALGHSMTPEEFKANPSAQEAVFRDQMQRSLQLYGPKDAASIWFTGKPYNVAGGAANDRFTSNSNYVARATAGLDGGSTFTPGPAVAGSGAPPAAPGAPAAPPATAATGTTMPGFQPGSPANTMAQEALKKLGGGGTGDASPEPMRLQQALPAQAVGGPMMMRPGGQNIAQPSLAAFGGGTRPPVPSMMPGQATGMPGLMGTTLNSPSQLQMALMSGQISPYDYYANAGSGGGGFGST